MSMINKINLPGLSFSAIPGCSRRGMGYRPGRSLAAPGCHPAAGAARHSKSPVWLSELEMVLHSSFYKNFK